jgi:hypothetical protein
MTMTETSEPRRSGNCVQQGDFEQREVAAMVTRMRDCWCSGTGKDAAELTFPGGAVRLNQAGTCARRHCKTRSSSMDGRALLADERFIIEQREDGAVP